MWYILSPDCNPDGTPCACKNIKSENVSYTGPTLSCAGIATNDNFTVILQKLDQKLCSASGGSDGSLKTLDGTPLDTTMKIISDNTDVQSPLRMSTTSLTNRGGGALIDNTAFGEDALLLNTTGVDNTAFGMQAMYGNTSAKYNTAVGVQALYSNQYGEQHVAVGAYALYYTVGNNGSNVFGHRCTAVGAWALYSNTNGNGTAIGDLALYASTTGIWNIAIGMQSGSAITTGSQNVIVATTGFAAPSGITTGNNNMILAPNNGNTTGITTGNGNVIVGKVSSLAAALENTVIVSDGVGNQRFISETNFLSRLPLQTNALITGGDGKSIITKEYVASQGITINSSFVPIGGSTTISVPAQVSTTNSLVAPLSSTSNNRTTIPGWTFPVTAGKKYRVEIIATYQSVVTTTGGSWGVILSSGTGTISGYMDGDIGIGAVATGLRAAIRAIDASNLTVGSSMTTSGVGSINTPHYMGGIMLFVCATSGVFEVQFASEVNASAAQMNIGSTLIVTEY